MLLNESFASTNEREGSEIGRQIVRALLESGVKVAYVTHMFDLASGLRAELDGEAAFLRAERLPDGRRTFRRGGANRCPPATARTSTAGSSARQTPARREPEVRDTAQEARAVDRG